MRLITVYILLAALISPAASGGETLQHAYDQAGPGSGYDKLIRLCPDTVYNGSLYIENVSVSISGSGALISFKETEQIKTTGFFSRLDINHCVLIGASGAALLYQDNAKGRIINNTIYGCWDGIRAVNACTLEVKNNIINGQDEFGLYSYFSDSGLTISYNDCQGNATGDYMRRTACNCSDSIMRPVPGTGEIYADPAFADPLALDFRLAAGSPCINAGENGENMGALPAVTGVGQNGWDGHPWSQVKAHGYPNPFAEKTVISYALKGPGRCRVAVYNLAGSLVKVLKDGPSPAGQHKLEWAGRDEGGNKLAAGLYFCRISEADKSRTVKLIIIR